MAIEVEERNVRVVVDCVAAVAVAVSAAPPQTDFQRDISNPCTRETLRDRIEDVDGHDDDGDASVAAITAGPAIGIDNKKSWWRRWTVSTLPIGSHTRGTHATIDRKANCRNKSSASAVEGINTAVVLVILSFRVVVTNALPCLPSFRWE